MILAIIVYYIERKPKKPKPPQITTSQILKKSKNPLANRMYRCFDPPKELLKSKEIAHSDSWKYFSGT